VQSTSDVTLFLSWLVTPTRLPVLRSLVYCPVILTENHAA